MSPRRAKRQKQPSKSTGDSDGNSDGDSDGGSPSMKQACTLPQFPFRLPPEFAQDPDRFEFWTVRVPLSVPLEDMEGCLAPNDSSTTVDQTQFQSAKSADYTIREGSTTENDTLCLMVPQNQLNTTASDSDDSDESDDDDDNDDKDDEQDGNRNKRKLVALNKGFSRHLNVVDHFKARSERELAPHPEEAPPVVDANDFKRPYSFMAQKVGLKRRWHPAGSTSASLTVSHLSAVVSDGKSTTTHPINGTICEQKNPVAVKTEGASNGKGVSAQEREAKKARKEEKKAKKEAKKKDKKVKKEKKHKEDS